MQATLYTLGAFALILILARLKAPERISVIARKNLGLGMPDPAQIIMVP